MTSILCPTGSQSPGPLRAGRFAWTAAALLCGALAACGGDGEGDGRIVAPAPTPASGVSPAVATISTLQSQAFTTASDGAAVTWQVDGVAGGNAEVGTISAGGLYAAPRRAGRHVISATVAGDPLGRAAAQIDVTPVQGVLTHHQDNARTGHNPRETVLTPATVGDAAFGKRASLPVDGFVYAQPLVVAAVPVDGRLRNLLIVATEHASVYAFDADERSGTPLWQRRFVDAAAGITTVPSADTQCDDISPEIGITSTPVVDPLTGLLYVVAMTKENGVHAHRLHALDLATGAEALAGGRLITASVEGASVPDDGSGRQVFASVRENQRAALLLSGGAVHVGFGSFCDVGDHHGWLMTYDAATLQPIAAFSATPRGEEGGIWQSGGGPAADAAGQVYLSTGDGTFDAASGGRNYGNSVLKLVGAGLVVGDSFTPYNEATLHDNDGDLGSGGVLLLPDQPTGPTRLLISAGKQGIVYLLDRDALGGHRPDNDSQVVQSFPVGVCGAGACPVFGSPALFGNTVYFAPVRDRLRAFTLADGRLTPASQSAVTFPWPGATPVVSSDADAHAIVWTLQTNGSGAPAVLRAHDAADLSVELFASDRNAARDAPGAAVKFATPVVYGGRVFVGVQGAVAVYGRLP